MHILISFLFKEFTQSVHVNSHLQRLLFGYSFCSGYFRIKFLKVDRVGNSCFSRLPKAGIIYVMNPTADLLARITQKTGQCGGRPCIRGMRIRVTDILRMLAEEMSVDEILADFPDLESADIQACLRFAAHQADRTAA